MKAPMTIRSKSAVAGVAFVLASVIPGNATVRQVPADYSTIQAAVDAAVSGDTIQIGAGVYTNQVVITNKSLTLTGSPGTVLRATPAMQSTLALYTGAVPTAAVVSIFESTNVVVSGLTFEGEHLAASQPGNFLGIWFLAAGGRVEDCHLTGFRGDVIDTFNGGWGVSMANPHNYEVGVRHLDILRSTFADNATSILLQGDVPTPLNTNWDPGLLSTTFTVNDNIIVGNGPDGTGAQVGIQITAGARGEVKRNTITGFSYTGDSSFYNNSQWAFGVIADDGLDYGVANLEVLQPLHFEGNIFRTNQIHMSLIRADGSTIINNSFQGTPPPPVQVKRPTGLVFTGDGILVASNRFSDLETGILLGGNDPEFPNQYLGVASNAVLTANGFCTVATNITVELPATYTEQGTLPNCPGPNLNVTRAVLLSWPYDVQGYAVESAPGLNGPWTTNTDATVFLQNGQNNAAIPADSDQQYFKLVKQP